MDNHVAEGKDLIALELKKKLYNKNKNLYFVGDTGLDFGVAKKIKASPLLVSWGHYNKERLLLILNKNFVFDKTADLKKFFLSL